MIIYIYINLYLDIYISFGNSAIVYHLRVISEAILNCCTFLFQFIAKLNSVKFAEINSLNFPVILFL